MSGSSPTRGELFYLTMSVDSIIDLSRYTFSQNNKGNFLYSIAIAQSMMDFSKDVDDVVVDNLPSLDRIGVIMTSFSPL